LHFYNLILIEVQSTSCVIKYSEAFKFLFVYVVKIFVAFIFFAKLYCHFTKNYQSHTKMCRLTIDSTYILACLKRIVAC
jgi:hypothetical protein